MGILNQSQVHSVNHEQKFVLRYILKQSWDPKINCLDMNVIRLKDIVIIAEKAEALWMKGELLIQGTELDTAPAWERKGNNQFAPPTQITCVEVDYRRHTF